MNKIAVAFLLNVALSSQVFALGGVVCRSDGAGVGGFISDQQDIVEAINCLGKQIAAANNRSASQYAIEAEAREIVELQRVVRELSREVEELKAVQARRP
ncbi:hypothetical protein [Methylosinus sp. PW1]|uniref:hypothetical protein n=1 Tax=Methylosinus sp. PW1 TaxID=107636 RepID=UPI00055A6684|nr:hypothetical protein [Methylosinus sp. PW1]